MEACMAAGGAEQAETYLRLLAEAELRRAPVLHGPGSQPHRVALAATALALADAVSLDTAWQVVADFQAACALRVGDPGPAMRSLPSPGRVSHLPASLTPSSRPSAVRHSVAQFLASAQRPPPAAPTGPSAGATAPSAVPIGATLPLPAEQEGWYGELVLLALARTDTGAAITVATRWAGQTRRSATPRPRHAPFHEVAAVDDRGVSYRAALWDMGIEDGREWWDCHLGLTPAPPDGIRWLDIGPGARGRYVRVQVATPDWAAGIATQPVPAAAAAARLLDRAGDELLASGPASHAAGLSLANRVALLITDLTRGGVLAADDPAVARLLGLGWRLGVDLGLPAGGRIPRAALPDAWHSMLADGDAADGPEGAAAFAASLPVIGGAWFSLAGLRSARDGATLHVLASGWTPHGNGWVMHGLGPHSHPGQDTLTWRARDSAGRWHLVKAMHWGSQQGMIQMQLVPPLHPAATALDVIVSDGSRQVSATVPLDWLPSGDTR
jgi:hypothetical protein